MRSHSSNSKNVLNMSKMNLSPINILIPLLIGFQKSHKNIFKH